MKHKLFIDLSARHCDNRYIFFFYMLTKFITFFLTLVTFCWDVFFSLDTPLEKLNL